MEETLRLCCLLPLPITKPTPPPQLLNQITQNAPSRLRLLPPSPRTPTAVEIPKMPFPDSSTTTTSSFREKILFLDSLDVDLPSLVQSHPSVLTSASLRDLRSAVRFLRSVHLSTRDLRRILAMCPQILTTEPSSMTSSITFLLREADVSAHNLRHVIVRRPRLLISDVASRLRPTLYFLRMLGVTDISRHTYLLSCSVEEKLVPRMDFLENYGFSPRETRSMVRRFPQMFCYSIEGNLRAKLDFLVGAMGRELGEVREFPHYFSYSLERRIKRRHEVCKEKGIIFTLPAMLRPSDEEFEARVEVCIGASPPLRTSPLWRTPHHSSEPSHRRRSHIILIFPQIQTFVIAPVVFTADPDL